jgi:hypothetical protein
VILLWGLPEDGPLDAAYRALTYLGAPVLFLDHAEVLENHLEAHFSPEMHGWIRTPDATVRLEEIHAAYLRPYDFRHLPEFASLPADSREWRHAMTFEDILWSWAELADALVLNRPSAMASNSSKPYQARFIETCGFRTPETLITTTPDSVRQFVGAHRQVIYKSVSGVRSVVSRLSADRMQSLHAVAWCPTQFQEYIAGTDYRVHVAGDEIFACRIASAADDYRYSSATMEACELPVEVLRRCLLLSESLRLPLCGIDLRLTPAGEWICFEVNPSPAYSCFENATGQPISGAIARLLADSAATAGSLSSATPRSEYSGLSYLRIGFSQHSPDEPVQTPVVS